MLPKYHHIENEYYKCTYCDKIIKKDELENEWKCSGCGEYLSIHVNYKGNKVLNRKHILEVEAGDHVLLRDATVYEVFENIIGDTKCKLRLKDFGTFPVNNDEFVNCVLGTW